MKLDFDKEEFEKFISEDAVSYWVQENKYPWYEKLWDTIKNIFDYRKIYGEVKRFYQRHTRGWDDSETWDLDSTFYKWVYPRLKKYKELNNGYPNEYLSPEDWDEELDKRIEQVRRILENDEFDFPYHEYLTPEDIDIINKRFGKKVPDQITYNIEAKNACSRDFLEWWKNNLTKLWW